MTQFCVKYGLSAVGARVDSKKEHSQARPRYSFSSTPNDKTSPARDLAEKFESANTVKTKKRQEAEGSRSKAGQSNQIEALSTSKVNASQAQMGFPIVGIGASAGGMEAFTQLLKHLPADTGMAFVLIQHLDP